jgi:hypothetical protein
MNPRYMTLSFLLTLGALSPTSAALAADTPAATDERNEIVVFGGISLLDASGQGQTTILPLGTNGSNAIGFGGRFRLPVPLPPISVESQTSLGSSALFGARYSRAIKDRLALEADLAIAPSHSLETRGSGCIGDLCFDRTSPARDGEGRIGRGFGDRNVTAWHYGAGLAYEITGGDLRPLLILGAGAVTWDGAREAETDFVFRFGAGLKILFGRVGARVDVVDHLVLDQFLTGKTEHDVHATAGLLVRF